MHPRLKAHIIHRIPGRMRIQIPAARHQEQFFAGLKQQLNAIQGVRNVTVNPAAASVTIEHDRNLDPLGGWTPALKTGPAAGNAEPSTCPCCGANPGSNSVSHGTEFDLVSLVTKLMPMVLPKHPIVQVAELVAEPVLRAIIGSAAERPDQTFFLSNPVASKTVLLPA
ncbi:hypothetical protein KEU06_27335 [Pseudaminobacter sp. 19-2017]|uniref:Heavy-metal-associated domain-containing protein n=1 Tax=Pseudaminobacter soli (ex Zhang et al. 2022) TaxID=2831468 RepID=A0A942I511_9HYPH|nr:hypothetical protein [Pseudaminobacter soli]MBS3652309.1 hypothetical protein [Pseudaminobacter soli]